MTAMTWIQVLPLDGTKRWDFLNPDPSSLDWPTIALVLARTPRFNGHTTQGPYSVAQHLVEGARAILRETARKDWAGAYLLHDAHEFVIGDDVRPKVEALASLASQAARNDSLDDFYKTRRDSDCAAHWLKCAFRELKERADAVIYPAAGLAWPLSSECAEIVRQYDNRMLRTEADARTGPRCQAWGDVVEGAEPVEGADCSPWSADLAASLWLSLAKEILPALASPGGVLVPSGCCCDAPLVPTLGETTGWTKWEPSMQDLRGWPDSPAPLSGRCLNGNYNCPICLPSMQDDCPICPPKEPAPLPVEMRVGDTLLFDDGRIVKIVASLDTIKSLPAVDAVFRKKLAEDERKADLRDWCDWADGSRRTPGTCTACGGVFGMLVRPSTCKR